MNHADKAKAPMQVAATMNVTQAEIHTADAARIKSTWMARASNAAFANSSLILSSMFGVKTFSDKGITIDAIAKALANVAYGTSTGINLPIPQLLADTVPTLTAAADRGRGHMVFLPTVLVTREYSSVPEATEDDQDVVTAFNILAKIHKGRFIVIVEAVNQEGVRWIVLSNFYEGHEAYMVSIDSHDSLGVKKIIDDAMIESIPNYPAFYWEEASLEHLDLHDYVPPMPSVFEDQPSSLPSVTLPPLPAGIDEQLTKGGLGALLRQKLAEEDRTQAKPALSPDSLEARYAATQTDSSQREFSDIVTVGKVKEHRDVEIATTLPVFTELPLMMKVLMAEAERTKDDAISAIKSFASPVNGNLYRDEGFVMHLEAILSTCVAEERIMMAAYVAMEGVCLSTDRSVSFYQKSMKEFVINHGLVLSASREIIDNLRSI